jgi:flagellar biosynthesis/type III secretory pathway protein FliH
MGGGMSELSNEQFKEIKEACLSSYQQGYREGFNDACEQLQQGVKNLIEAANEVFKRSMIDGQKFGELIHEKVKASMEVVDA